MAGQVTRVGRLIAIDQFLSVSKTILVFLLMWLLFTLLQFGFSQNSYVSAINSSQGWSLVGENIYRTSDGGQTWENLNGLLTQVSALDYNTSWGVNSFDGIFRTANGGQTWESVPGALKYVSALDYNTAWGVNSANQIWRTLDGGVSWENIATNFFKQISAVDYNTAWGVDTNDAIYRTFDGGQTWESVSGALKYVSALDYNTAWGVNSADQIWRTVDGGLNWENITGGLKQVSAVDYNTSWGVSSDEQFWRTSDGGQSWASVVIGQQDAATLTPTGTGNTAPSAPSQFTGDLESIIKNGVEWSASSNVFRSSLSGFTEKYGSRDGAHYHINGIAYTQSKRLVINHSLEEDNNDSCGSVLAYSMPYEYIRDNEVTWTITCLSSWHPSMMHAAGNIVAVTDSALRFFEFDSSPDVPIRELTHLNIADKYDAVAIAYRQQDSHYYLMTAALADEGYLPIKIWRDSLTDANGPPCANLADATCSFVSVGTIDSVYASSSGMGLVDQPDGKMILMAMYSAGADADHITATEIDVDTLTAREIGWENIGLTQTQVYTTRPSCRWGCSVNVVDGQLFILWAGRDIGNVGDVDFLYGDDFEMAIYMIENPTYISVSIATANVSGGGTDSNITLTIHGTTGDSAPVNISSLISGDALEYGTTDTINDFPLSQAIGDPIAVTLQTDYSYPGAAWLPASVTVTIGEKTLTVYNTTAEWLDEENEILRLDSTEILAATTATVSIATADESGAGTDSNIMVTIHGSNGDSPAVVINPYLAGNAFERNTTDSTSEFPLGKDIGTPTAVTLQTDYAYSGAAWLPMTVTVIIDGQTFTATNATGEWLDDYNETLTLILQ